MCPGLPDGSTRVGRPFPALDRIAPLGVLLLFVPAFFLPVLAGGPDLPGGLGDPRFNLYVLEHIHRWIVGVEPSLLSPPMFYPYPHTLGFSDMHAGTAWLYAIGRLVGLDGYGAFKLWFAVGYVASYGAAYVALRRLAFDRTLAAVGAFAFAFCLPAIVKIGHAQLAYRIGVPFCALFAFHLVERPTPSALVGLALATAVQFLCSIYLGVFCLLMIVAVVLGALTVRTGGRPRAALEWSRGSIAALAAPRAYLTPWALAALLLVVFALTTLLYHRYVSDLYGFGRSWGEIASMLPRPTSFLLMDGLGYWGPVSRALGADIPGPVRASEHQLFLGVPMLLLFAVAAVRAVLPGAGRTLRLWVIAALAAPAVIVLIGDGTGYELLVLLPGFDAVRAVSRYVLVGAFPVTVAVLVLLRDHGPFPTGIHRMGVHAAALVLALWLTLDIFLLVGGARPGESFEARVDAAIEVAEAARPEGTGDALAFVVGGSQPIHLTEIDAMLAAQRLGVPTINGYSGNFPPGYNFARTCAGARRQIAHYRYWSAERGIEPAPTDAIQVVGDLTCTLGSDDEPTSYGPPPSADEFPHIELHDPAVGPDGNGGYVATVDVLNGMDRVLPALGEAPVRLSWAWSVTDDPAALDWAPRVDLPFGDIPPGEVRTVRFAVPPPPPGVRTLQVSAVVDGLYWLWHLGVAPVSATLPGAVGPAGPPDQFAPISPRK